MQQDVIVIGGGAGGMMAAIAAGQLGAKVLLLEKNDILGKKMLIAGKGRCNITNDKEIQQLIEAFPHNGRFLYTAFNRFSNQDTKEFFTSNGVPLKVERGDRVFPVSDRSKDIVQAMEKQLRAAGVKIKTKARVVDVRCQMTGLHQVVLANGEILEAERVIVATGGASYPGTGSTGDGYGFARNAGHEIVALRPALVPLNVAEVWVKELQGLSLKNVTLTLTNQEGKVIAEDFGEMLFTHFGISGPIVLTVSGQAVDYWQKEKTPLKATIDLKPALSEEKLDARLLREIEAQHKKQLKNSLSALLPAKLIPVFLKLTGLEAEKMMYQLTKAERQKMVQTLKNLTLTVTGTRPLEEAIVTAGGVQVKEISPKTMESKIVPGLYFVGEVLDIDGVTGGFNLQAALSTGYLAGQACIMG
ncbi:MAG: NAD(P)/FAD-dependent oxidoreductase [Peptococcaceae bacterium]|nr:NAD(P)/FAD-dependent oxidoreductase [Peptococcaceae bacterium]